MIDRKPANLRNPSATCAAGPRSKKSGHTRQAAGRKGPSTD